MGAAIFLLEARSVRHPGRASERAAGNNLLLSSALGLAGVSGALHPGEEGGATRQLIGSSRRREESGGERSGGALPGPHHPLKQRGGGGYAPRGGEGGRAGRELPFKSTEATA